MSEQAEPRTSERALRDLSAQWRAAADRAFGSGLTDPTRYALTVRLVRATLDRLKTQPPDADTLLTAWSERAELLGDVIDSDDLLTADGLDLESVAGAAFAMRYREVAAEIVLAQRREALAAQGEDRVWAVVEQIGPHDGDIFVPYRRLEANLQTGQAILVTTRANDDFTAPVHSVESLRINGSTGELSSLPEAGNDTSPPEFTSVEEREQHVETLKAEPVAHNSNVEQRLRGLPDPKYFL